jgi:hypothetical protein
MRSSTSKRTSVWWRSQAAAAESNLDEFPPEELLARFPEGKYYIGVRVGGVHLAITATLSHAVPDRPSVSAEVDGKSVIIRWDPVKGPAEMFPDEKVGIVGY